MPRLTWRLAGPCFEISWNEAVVDGRDGRTASFDVSAGTRPEDWTGSLALLLLARVAADHGGELETARGPP